MITFPCKCGNRLVVPDDQAGGLLQCEKCGLLVDVPTSDDLPNLREDGTFEFDDSPPVDDGVTLADRHRFFTNRTLDDDGNEKDLRPTPDHFERIGVIDERVPEHIAPRYDPFTGELIRPLQFKDEEPVPVLAIAAPAAEDELPPVPVVSLTYAAGEHQETATFSTVAAALFQPVNITVMTFMFVFFVLAYLAKIPLNTFIIYFNLPMVLALLPNVFLWLIVAHYGCVAEDTGPEVIDELPRPMRFFDFGDDLFRPLFRFMLAVVICYLPMLVLDRMSSAGPNVAVVLALFAAGSFFFPAVLLTSLTGTTVLNLGPTRVLGVIGICGTQYLIAAATGAVAFLLTVALVIGPVTFPELTVIPGIRYADRIVILFPGTVLAIYLGHLFMWQLGLLYRRHHDEFPWMAQRHIRTPR